MNPRRYLLRSLWFYRRTHLGVVIGSTLASMVLVGALTIGDSVRYSLTQLTLSRLGRSEVVLTLPERFFPADLAERLQGGIASKVAPVLLLNGVALSPEGDRRINAVQVVGVDDRFWAFAPEPTPPPDLEHRTCVVNQAFADRMQTRPGDGAFVLRLRLPGGLPTDMALATREQDSWSSRLQVAAVNGPEAFGHFSLQPSQRPPPTVFLPRAWLSAQLEIDDQANLLLLQTDPSAVDDQDAVDALQSRLEAVWRLADGGLRVESLPDGVLALHADRVFIDEHVVEAARRVSACAQPVIAYFVNSITAGDRTTPYSFVAAPGDPIAPEAPGDDRNIERLPSARINDWLASDLSVSVGDTVTLSFYRVDSGGRLAESETTLVVADIVEAEAVAGSDRHLVPHVPGLSDVENCRDWDPGIPIDLEKIRARDEAYWDAYGPLPKLYLPQSLAATLWRNRFGTYTQLRFPPDEAGRDDQTLAEAIRRNLSARELGFVFRPVKAEGLAASRHAVDFGHLFAGLSFFLIAAAVLLTALLFAFSVRQRTEETGILRALGFHPGTIRTLLLREGLLLVTAGSLIGGFLALGYNVVMLNALQTIWHDAVRTSAFRLHARPVSIAAGVLLTALTALSGMALAIRGQSCRTIRDLQQPEPDTTNGASKRWAPATGLLCLTAALLLAATAAPGRGHAAMGRFFAVGGLLLIGLLALTQAAMHRVRRKASRPLATDVELALRGATRRCGRSLACMALMALGVFLVMAVAANRRGGIPDPGDPASGTGGYRLWGQSTLPLVHDLNTARGRARYGLGNVGTNDATFLHFRLQAGDDASCLNLNRVGSPHLLGVDAPEFDRRGAFRFARLAEGIDSDRPWTALEQDFGADVVPAFADQADITWGLGKAIGDALTYRDEQGRDFRVKLVGGLTPSIFQGHLLIDARHLEQRFPSLGGTRIMLIDVPAARAESLRRELTLALADLGFDCEPTGQRLATFQSVENTYLSIFLLLGGLGILVGSAGMGVVAARNILERRSELALLRAVGFRAGRIRWLIVLEHGLLAATGILIGTIAALVAVIPALLSPEAAVPWPGLLLTLFVLLGGSLLWILAAVCTAFRGSLLSALRHE